MRTVKETKKFLKQAFKKNPHYSFNNWRIMYRHSLRVMKFARRIAKSIPAHREILLIGSLLHDIGKTYRADEKMLRAHHAALAYEVSKNFIRNLHLTNNDLKLLENILNDKNKTVEQQIIEDADIIAFLADKKLQSALHQWAKEQNLPNELKRKLNKINELHFATSRSTAQPYYLKMKNRWQL